MECYSKLTSLTQRNIGVILSPVNDISAHYLSRGKVTIGDGGFPLGRHYSLKFQTKAAQSASLNVS